MLRSGLSLDPRQFARGFRMMTPTDMDRALMNLDHRMLAVEKILPTLATKKDLERLATKEELKGFATIDALAETKSGLQAQMESVRDDIRIVAEGVVALERNVRTIGQGLASLTSRLEHKGLI